MSPLSSRSSRRRAPRAARSLAARSLVFGALAAVATSAHAQGSNFWTNGGDGQYWDSLENWLLGAPGGNQWLYVGYDGWAIYPHPARTELRMGDVAASRLYSKSDFTLSGGSLRLTDATESGLIDARFTFSGGGLINDGALGVKDLTWSGGTLSGTGSLNVSNSAEIAGIATWTGSNALTMATGKTLRVDAGATLVAGTGTTLSGGTLDNAGEVRFADYNSQNAWSVDALVNSGTLSRTDNYGSVALAAGVVTNTGDIVATGNYYSSLSVASTGDFDNEGTVRSGGYQSSNVTVSADGKFVNGGTIVLDATYDGRLTTQAGTDYLNAGTIRSTGYYDSFLQARANGGAFTNQGTLLVDGGSYYYVRLDAYGSTGLVNEGTVDLNAVGAYARLSLDSGGDVLNAVGAQILNRSGGYDGTLESSAAGDWTNEGSISASGYYAQTQLSAGGDWINSGTLDASGYASTTTLTAAGGFTNGGLLRDSGNYATLNALAGGAFTNEGAIEKHGYGEVHLGGTAGSDNSAGTILADTGNVWLDRNWSTGTLGTLTTQNGGTIRLGGTLDNAGHDLDMATLAGGGFMLDGGTVRGGNVLNFSSLRVTGNSGNTLDSVHLDGDLSLIGNAYLRLRNTPIPAGVSVALGDPNYSQWGYATLALDQDQTLSGNAVTMAGYPYATIVVENGHALTVGADSRIVGDSIRIYGATGAETLDNHGLIRGYSRYYNSFDLGRSMGLVHNEADGTITADGISMPVTSTNFHNEGLAQATNGGFLDLNSTLDNDGTIRAVGAGSVVRLHGAFANDPAAGLSWNDVKATGGGEIQLAGSLANAGATLDPVDAAGDGTFRLTGATLVGGSLIHSGALRFDGSTNVLDGTTLDGGLDLSQVSSYVRLQGGTTLATAPTIKIGPRDGYYYNGSSRLDLDQDLALVGTDVQFGTNYYPSYIQVYGTHSLSLDAATAMKGRMDVSGSGGALSNAGLISAEGGYGYDASLGSGFATFDNSGTIQAKDFGASLNLYGPLANSGSIVADGSTVYYRGGNLLNTGHVRAIDGGYVGLYNGLDNQGTIRAEGSGARIGLLGSYVTGDWNDLKAVDGGSVELGGTLDNSAQAGYDLTNLVESGGTFRLTGGRISGGGLANSGMLRYDGNGNNTLSGVTLDSDLDLSEPGSVVTLRDGTTMPSSPTIKIGSSANVYDNSSTVYLAQDADFADTTVQFGAQYYYNLLRMREGYDLTVEADSVLRGKFYIESSNDASDLVNRGLISAEGLYGYEAQLGNGFGTVENAAGATIQAKDLGSALYLYGSAWHNAGTLTADASTVYFYGGSLANDGLVQAKNGGYFALNNLANGSLGSILATGAGSRVRLNGSFTTSALGAVHADGGGEIQLGGALDNVGATLDLSAIAADGTFRLTGGGIAHGSVAASDHLRFENNYYNYLSDVALDHGLNLEEYGSAVRLYAPISLGDGTIRVGRESELIFANDQTFDGAIQMVEAGSTGYTRYVRLDNGSHLTLGPNASITSDGGGYSNLFTAWYYGPSGFVLNQGLISAGAGASFSLNGDTITNAGTIEAKNGGYLELYPSHFHNTTGTLQAVGGGSVVRLGYNLATADLGHVEASDGGELQLASHLDNSGATLDLAAIAATGDVRLVGGSITGGSVANSGALRFNGSSGNYLQGVALDGDLNLAPYNSATRVYDGLNVGGRVRLGQESYLVFSNSQTFDGHVTMDGTISPNGTRYLGVDGGSTLTLGPDAVIDTDGSGAASLFWARFNGPQGATVNQGSISAGAGARFDLGGDSLSNQGAIQAKDGGQVYVASSGFSNLGGTLRADGANSYVTLNYNLSTATLGHLAATGGGDVSLGGTVSNTGTTLDLSDIDSTSTFSLYGGIVGGNVTNSGALRFNGSYANLLQGTILDGDLNLARFGSAVRVLDGLTMGGAVHVGTESRLIFADDEAFHGHVEMDRPGGEYYWYNRYLNVDNGSHLTLSDDSSIDSLGGGYSTLFNPTGGAYGTVTNDGRITAGTGATFYLEGASLANQGTLEAKGGTLQIDAVLHGAGGTLKATGSGSNVRVSQDLATANLGSLVATGGGDIGLNGVIDNVGATLDLSGVDSASTLSLSSLVGGNVVNSSALRFGGSYGNYLQGVTLDSDLDLSRYGTQVRVLDGLNVGGTVHVGTESRLIFAADATLHGHVEMDRPDGEYYWYNRYLRADNGAQVTLASDAIVDSLGGGTSYLFDVQSYGPAGSVTNQGRISAGAGASFYLRGDSLTNAGTIEAKDGGFLQIDALLYGAGGSLKATGANSRLNLYHDTTTADLGRLVATGGGQIQVQNRIDNTGATLDLSGVDAASKVYLHDGAGLVGGEVVNSGALGFNGSYWNYLQGTSLDGDLHLSTYGTQVRVLDGLTVGGTVHVGTESRLIFASDGAFHGRIELDRPDGESYWYNRYLRVDNGAHLTLGSDASVDSLGGGTSSLFDVQSYGPNGTVTNEGRISAGAGATFYLGGASIRNSGTIGAKDGGFLTFNAPNVDNTGGALSAVGLGSIVSLSGDRTSVATGRLIASGGGLIRLSSNVANAGATFDMSGVTDGTVRFINGTGIVGGAVLGSAGLRFDSNDSNHLNGVTLDNGLDLSESYERVRVYDSLDAGVGPVKIGPESNLIVANDATLSGSFQMVAGVDAPYYYTRRLNVEGGSHLTLALGSSITSVGGGNAELFYPRSVGGESWVTNQGLISAGAGASWSLYGTHLTNAGTLQADGGSISLYSGDLANSGLIAAKSGGYLNLNGRTVQNAGGRIKLDGGGTVNLNGSTVAGGRIEGSSTWRPSYDYNNVVDGVTLDSGLAFDNYNLLRVKNGLTNEAGTFDFNGYESALVFDGDQTFGGNVRFNAGGWNYVGAEGATQLTLGPNSSIVGAGNAQIGRHWNVGGANAVTNQGTIQAQTGANWNLNSESFANEGALDVSAGATVNVSGSSFHQTAGTTDVSGNLYANSPFDVDGGSLTGTGTIHGSVVNGGFLRPSTGLGSLSITGDFAQTSTGVLDLFIGGLDRGQFSSLRIGGSATLGGTLDVGFLNGYAPNPGDTFRLLDFNGYNGGSFTLGSTDPGYSYALSYSAAGAFLTVAGAPGYVYWIGNGSNTATDWSTLGAWSSYPVPTDRVTNGYADRTIVHSVGTDVVQSLKSAGAFTLSGGTVAANDPATSTFQVNNVFTLSGGALKGFTVQPGVGGQGVTVQGTGSILDGANVLADVSVSGAELGLAHGARLRGTTTLANGGLVAAATDLMLAEGTFAFAGYGDSRLSAGTSVLTLGGAAFAGDRVHVTSAVGGKVVNDATFDASGAGAAWTLDPASLDNEGFLKATNAGHLTVAPTAYARVGDVTANGAGSLVDLMGGTIDFATSAFHSVDGGTIRLATTLDLGGGAANGSALAGSGTFRVDGTIRNGTLSNTSALTFGDATLDGVTIDGGLTLRGGAHVRLANGVSGGAYTLADYARIGIVGSASLSNSVFTFGNYYSGIDLEENAHLTVGNGMTIQNVGKVTGPATGHATLEVAGALGLYSGGGLRVDPTDLSIDAGSSVNVGSGGLLTMEGGTFTNDANSPATGHYVHAFSGGTLDLAPDHFVNNGVIEVGSVTSANLHPIAWDKVGTLNASGSNATIRLGGGTIHLGAGDVLHAQDGGGFRLQTTLDNAGALLDPEAIGGDFVLDGGTIKGGTLNTGSSYLGFSGSANNVLDGVQFVPGAGLTMQGGQATIRGDVLNYSGFWHLDAGAGLTFEDSRQFERQAFLLDNGTLRSVADPTTPAVEPTMVFGDGTTITGKNATIDAVNLISRSRFSSEAGGTWYLNVSNQLDNSLGDDATGHGFIEAGANSALYLHAGKFANNDIVDAKHGGWLDATADVWSRVGTVQATGQGSTVALRGGTIVIGQSDGLYAYDGGVVRLGTTLDNTANWLNPGLVTNTYVNGDLSVGYNGDYFHGAFWGRVKGGGIDSQSYALRFENAELENVSLTTADPAQDGDGNFIHLAGLDLHNEHVHVLGGLTSSGQFALTDSSALYFDGNRDFHSTFDTSHGDVPIEIGQTTFDFAGYGNSIGLLGAGTLTIGNGTVLHGASGSQFTVDMTGGGTLNLANDPTSYAAAPTITGPTVRFVGGTLNNGITMGASGVGSSWSLEPANLNNAGGIGVSGLASLSIGTNALDNAGTLSASTGGRLTVRANTFANRLTDVSAGYAELYGGTWTDVGQIDSKLLSTVRLAGGLTNDGSLDARLVASLGGQFMLGFGRFRDAGVVQNAGQTFDPNHTGGAFTLDNGHVVGGNLVVTDGSGDALPIFANSYWDGYYYYYGHGDNLLDGAKLVDTTGALAPLDLTNGGTVSVANDPNPDWNDGHYRLDNGARLSYNTDSTLNHATVDLGTHGTSEINPYGSTLTIGSDVTFSGTNGVVGEFVGYQPTNKIVNGANIASHDGGAWSVAPYALENHGILSASNGSTLYATPYRWDKLGLVSVSGLGSTLYLGATGQGTIQRQDASDDFQFSNQGRIVLGAHLVNRDANGNALTLDAIANDGYFEVRGGAIEGGSIRVNAPSDRSLSAFDWQTNFSDPRFTFTRGYTGTLQDVALVDGVGAAAGLDLRDGASVRILGTFGSSNAFLLGSGASLSFGSDRSFSGTDAANFHFTNGGTVGADGLLTLGTGSNVDGADIAFGGGGLRTQTPIVAGESLRINSGTLTNESTIGISDGGTAYLSPGTWAKVGALRSDGAGSLMHLGGGALHPDWTSDTIRASGGGAFELNTTLDNGANVGPFDPSVIGGKFTVYGGTILGGSVVSLSNDLRLPFATFDGVKLTTANGTTLSGLSLDGGESLLIRGAFDGVNQSNGQFAIDRSTLAFDDDRNRTFTSETHFSVLSGQLNPRSGSTLTLDGASLTGADVRVGDAWWFGANTGGFALAPSTHLAASGAGDTWAITPYALDNRGSIAATNGATNYLTVANWQNAGVLLATGAGSRIVLDGGTIHDQGGAFLPTATPGAQIEVRNVLDNVGTFLDPNGLGGGTLQIGGSDYAYSDNYVYSKAGTIYGGALNTASSHLVFTHEPQDHSWNYGYDNVLDGVKLVDSSGVTLAGLDLSNGGTVRLANGYSLNGNYTLDHDARITFGDDKTFGAGSNFTFGAGGGTLALWDHRVVRFEDGVSMTGPNATVTGDDASRLVNTTTTPLGPTSVGSAWTFSTQTLDNQGALFANDGATLTLATNLTNHAGRTVSATNGGVVRFEGPSPSRGQVSNAGTLSTQSGGTLLFENNAQLTNTGTVSIADGTLRLDSSSLVNTGGIGFSNGALSLSHSAITSVNGQDWSLARFSMDASSIVGATSSAKVAIATTETDGSTFMFSPSHDNYFENVDFKVTSAADPANLGVMDLTNGGYLRVRDSVINAHEIKLGNGGTIAFDNNVAIAADELTFQGGGSTLNLPMAAGSSLTFANGMKVSGVLGSIGGQLPGTPPSVQPRDFINEADILIQNNAAQDGAASIDSTSFKNTGTVKLDPNAKLVLNAATLNAGVFQTALGSDITIGAGFVQTEGLLINNGTVDIAAGNVLEIQGGTIKGNGVVNGQVVNGSVLNVGNSPGHMTINGDYTATATATFDLEIAGLEQGVNPGYDWLDVNGNVALGGTLSLSLLDGYDFTGSADYTFLTYSGLRTGSFSTFLTNGADLHGGSLSLVYGASSVGLHYTQQAVPEPGSLLAIGAGLATLVVRRRRRK